MGTSAWAHFSGDHRAGLWLVQGTLFGKNTAGGAINITTVRPGQEFGGYVVGTVGSDSLYGGKFSVNVPVTDSVAARFSYGQHKRVSATWRFPW